MTALAVLLMLLAGAYLVAMLEGWAATGRLRVAGPALSAAALLGQESIVPRRPDRILFEVAPVLLLVSAILAAAVLPFGPSLVIADMATGALFVNAALAYVMVALLMAGWGPDGAYAMVAGWRFLGQLVGYSMPIVMAIAAIAMRAESLRNTAVVESQAALPNALYQPVGFAVFFLAAMCLAFLPPFDLPTAGELAGGVEAEYAGARLAVMRLGRMVLVVTLSAAVTVFYLGGWHGPLLPGWAWSAIKTLAVAAAMLAAGRYVPRIREADLLAWWWKLGIPLALANIFWVGVLLLVVK
ncbi:NADH-quinone oxidoreductase subunit H [Rubrobacter xylanophilus DSM 9941]|uniref:complex I subunit 1 family protein n=1 Tax=Rubrobacter xylanophilus TaxID=49319 RepID=UPI001F46A641|nr:complex I subunit 1 family protein [Rubrobacter xylanophilus]QYJ16351.1 NADH-quinone oxidoreductase subunit H [Rubrobacter xylanophilus DSM 9941]